MKPADWLLDPSRCPGFQRAELVAHEERPPQIHHTEHLHVVIPKRYALVNITDEVESVLARSKITDGLCFVSAMHITAGVYVNDAESGLIQDIDEWLEGLTPYGQYWVYDPASSSAREVPYRHHRTGEDNGDAHLKY